MGHKTIKPDGAATPYRPGNIGKLVCADYAETSHFLQLHRLIGRFGLSPQTAEIVALLAFGLGRAGQ